MTKELKKRLIIYMALVAVLFPYLVLCVNAGIGVLVFSLVNFLCLWFVVPDRKCLYMYIPIFVMSLNCFISDSNVWRVPNMIVSIFLFLIMFMKLDMENDSMDFFSDMLEYATAPLFYFDVPLKWARRLFGKKSSVIVRVAIALLIAVPGSIALIVVLSNADMVFNLKTSSAINKLFSLFSFNALFKMAIGILVSFVAFGALYNSYKTKAQPKEEQKCYNGDLLIINIVLAALLLVYTLFVFIQFKYLFAGNELPYGLTYTEYARKGFFELLVLSGVNIAVILTVVKLTKRYSGKWHTASKIQCHYLCAVTIVLLVSSYVRMSMYIGDDGLTRLRLFVVLFLAFEVIGLALTFVYIAVPRFNLVLVYLLIALVYYSLLNLLPTDYIIAKNQISKFLNGERNDVAYVFTLSADAAPAVKELLENTTDTTVRQNAYKFLKECARNDKYSSWQSYNFSHEMARQITG